MKQMIRNKIGRFSMALLLIYGVIIIYFFLFSDRLGRVDGYDTYHYNLTLLYEIRRFIKYRESMSTISFVINIIGNLLVFFPIGFLLPIWRSKKIGLIKVMGYSFLFSLIIETLQLITRVGVFDVDDLMMNTLGAVLGWICYYFSSKVFRKKVWSKLNF